MRRPFLASFVIAMPLSGLLWAFATLCGAIHGAPACGVLSYAAVPLVVIALLIERALFDVPQSEGTVLVLIWAAAYVLSLVMVVLGFSVWRALRGRTETTH